VTSLAHVLEEQLALQTCAGLSDCSHVILHDDRGDAWLKVFVFENSVSETGHSLLPRQVPSLVATFPGVLSATLTLQDYGRVAVIRPKAAFLA